MRPPSEARFESEDQGNQPIVVESRGVEKLRREQ
jgi:hypothetical protein